MWQKLSKHCLFANSYIPYSLYEFEKKCKICQTTKAMNVIFVKKNCRNLVLVDHVVVDNIFDYKCGPCDKVFEKESLFKHIGTMFNKKEINI